MKKFLVILTIFCLLAGTAVAESTNYSSMTDEELHRIVDLARNELAKRELIAEGKTILFEEEGVQLYLTGEYKVDIIKSSGNVYIDLEVVVSNNSNQTVSVLHKQNKASVNGWDVYGEGISNTNPGKKQKGRIRLKISDAEIGSYEEIEDIEFRFTLYNPETYKTIRDIDPVTLHFNIQ